MCSLDITVRAEREIFLESLLGLDDCWSGGSGSDSPTVGKEQKSNGARVGATWTELSEDYCRRVEVGLSVTGEG